MTSQLELQSDGKPADWVVESINEFGVRVGSVIPTGFESYVRLAHRGNEPDEGTVPKAVVGQLTAILGSQTSTPDNVWFCVWDGFGSLSINGGGQVLNSSPSGGLRFRTNANDGRIDPTVRLPNREYHLFFGPIQSIETSFAAAPFWQSANLWWPDDRAWCVATEIDAAWTFIGGNTECLSALIESPGLDVAPVNVDDAL